MSFSRRVFLLILSGCVKTTSRFKKNLLKKDRKEHIHMTLQSFLHLFLLLMPALSLSLLLLLSHPFPLSFS